MFDRIELRPYYRKIELLTPEWPTDIDLEYMQIVAAPYGGPLAIKRDARKLVPVKGTCQDVIRILDTAGTEMGHILWNHGKLISMDWSDNEDLICILESAKVIVFDMFGNEKESYSICSEANVIKIVEAKVFQTDAGTGIAVMTKSGQIFLKQNSKKSARKLPNIPSPSANIFEHKLPDDPNSNGNCSCWEIVTDGRNSYCLLARDTEVIKLMHGQTVGSVTEILFEKPYDRIVKISVSYNHQHLALYTNTGLLWLGSVDMQQKYCEFDTGRQNVPLQIEWIMNTHKSDADAVVISYASHLLIVNRYAEMVNVGDYSFDPIMCLVPEMDSVRIITQSSHEIIHSLPKCVDNIFHTCSLEPSCLLFMAQKKFKQKSEQAFEYLGSCHEEIELAVKECIEAAAYEFCSETQKNLMRAAYFGKVFIPSHNPRQYLRTLKILRVLNALRDKKIAMPLTYKQFFHLNPEVVLGRLVFRKHYGVAIQISKYLNLPESWIFEHWAYHEAIKDPNHTDTEVARKITEKMNNSLIEDISFCNMAEKAHQSRRDELAIKLLELEPRVSLHVPFLLKLGEFNRALSSATQSGDTELITSVLLEIMNKMMLSDIHMLIRDYPLAFDMYKNIMFQCNRSALSEIYNSEDDHKSIAEFHLCNAIDNDELESNLSVIKNSYAQGRCTVEAELCADTERMLEVQKTLAIGNNDDECIKGLSIHDTIMLLLREGNLRKAEEIKSEFKVPDARFWWMRILTLSYQENWVELEKFSKSKKSPIGYQPFVEVCLQKNNSREALKYIERCPDKRKVHWFMRAYLHEEAINCAFKQKDLQSLYEVQTNIQLLQNPALNDELDSYIATLERKRYITYICNISYCCYLFKNCKCAYKIIQTLQSSKSNQR